MTRFFLRINTDCCTLDAEQKASAFLRSLHGITDIHMEPIAPYGKQPAQGELQVSFLSALPMAEIQALLADCWEGEVADSRWSCVHVPHAVFLWLTFYFWEGPMNGNWMDTFQGIIPRNDYTVQLSAGEETGLVVTLKSETTAVTVSFGNVQAYQMLDEGTLLQGSDSEQFAAIRAENFPSTIYEIENGDFGRYIEVQMGQDLFCSLQLRQYIIVTYNYVISVVSSWPPEIIVKSL